MIPSIMPDVTENLTLTDFLPGDRTVAPMLTILFVRPNSGLFEPLWPTVVLARTKLLHALASVWVPVETTLDEVEKFRFSGPFSVSI